MAAVRVLITGDRKWLDYPRLCECLDDFMIENVEPGEEAILVTGMAMGADIMGYCWASWQHYVGQEMSWDRYIGEPDCYPADWTTHGRAAGPIRNQQMLDSGVDYVIGFHNDIESSRGTRDMLRRCARAGIPGRLFTEETEVLEWQTLVL